MNAVDPLVTDFDRLAELKAFGVLDTAPEEAFDDLVHLTARLCDTPVALISLVDGDRQWFKARTGFAGCESDLDSSVCKFVLAEPDLLVIPDLAADARTVANPLVTGEPGVRFYAGAPLRTRNGHVLGSLCAIDTRPRPEGLTHAQRDDLRILARLAMRQLEARRTATASAQAERQARALVQLGDRLRDLRDPARMAWAAAEIIGRTLCATRAGYAVVTDARAGLASIEAEWRAPGVGDPAGKGLRDDHGLPIDDMHGGGIVLTPDVRRDPRTRAAAAAYEARGVRAMINAPLLEHGRLVAVQFVHWAQPQADLAEFEPFVRNVVDRVRVGVERVRAEEQQVVVNREISHRLKNTLAMVQAIAAQTLKGVAERGPVEAFDQRLQALSCAHDLLLATSWTSADLADVVRAVIANVGELPRCDAQGPAIRLGPRATLAASLLVHELATNALKYGSLSAPSGTVRVRWGVDGSDAEAAVRLTWTERGGPAPVAPTRKGFGSRLLAMGLVGTGGATLGYASEGFHAAFSAPLAEVQGA